MAEVTSHVPGTPCWADLSSPDLERSKAFYRGVFGWSARAAPEPEAGGYTMFSLRGKQVAGLGPTQGGPPAWCSYIAVTDADAIASRAERAGGSVLAPPFDVLDAGRMAILVDPAGAVIGLWQARAHHGAELIDEPGALCWSELLTREPKRCTPFYEAVFGWKAQTSSGELPYTEWRLGARTIAGMLAMGADFPPDVPAHWAVYFAVTDCVACAGRAQELGARVVRPPTAISPGYFATLLDPHGAPFNLLEFREAA